jgi:hypothetical protein
MMLKKIKKNNSGYSLIETVFYVALFTILSVALLQVMITMTGSFLETIVNRNLVQGSSVVENMSRELKQAYSFSFASNILIVNTLDNSGNPKTVTFTFSNPNISVVDSVLGNLGNLNPPSISVTSFSLNSITTPRGKAAKISLAVHSNSDSTSRTENFYDTVVLRGDYYK